jgi:hypothetical protein
MTLRVFAAIGAVIVGILIMGCGGDGEEDSPAPAVEKEPEPTFGLDGDTYRNRRLFKVSNLPVDDWTVKEVTKAVEGEKPEHFLDWLPLPFSLYHTTYTFGEDFFFDQVSNGVISLLLMQPTSEENFADTVPEAEENEIPYIYISIEVQSTTDIKSSREVALVLLEQTGVQKDEVTNQGAIFSKDRRHGYFWEVTFNEIDFKVKQSFFVRSSEGSRYIYRLLFVSPIGQYDAYVSVYDKVVSAVEFRL